MYKVRRKKGENCIKNCAKCLKILSFWVMNARLIYVRSGKKSISVSGGGRNHRNAQYILYTLTLFGLGMQT